MFFIEANIFYDLLRACTDSSLSVGDSVVIVVVFVVVVLCCVGGSGLCWFGQQGCIIENHVLQVVLFRHKKVVLSFTRTENYGVKQVNFSCGGQSSDTT